MFRINKYEKANGNNLLCKNISKYKGRKQETKEFKQTEIMPRIHIKMSYNVI